MSLYLTGPTHLHVRSSKLGPNSIHGFFQFSEVHSFSRSAKPSYLLQNPRYSISCAMNMTAGQSDDPGRIKLDHLLTKARKLWDNSPQPVKKFPWKKQEVPWHLFILAVFFTLLKLPGPYYPYWGRIIIPHVVNGGLLRTLLLVFTWYRRPRKASSHHSTSGSHSKPNEL